MLFVTKLKILTLMTCLMLVGQAFALDCATGTQWGDFHTQEMTKDDEGFYNISEPEELAWIACKTTHDSTNYKSSQVRLTKDIDLQGKLFIPISAGKGDPKFRGTLDGQGHTIRGLFIKGSEIAKPEVNGMKNYAQNIGLVAVLSTGGIIRNLTLDVSDIYASNSAGDEGTVGTSSPISVGTLVGWMDAGTIENCIVEGRITTSGDKNRVGGLVGNVNNANISNSVCKVSISSSGNDTHVGGVVGALRKGGTVNLTSCVFEGDTLISTGGMVGGIVGYYENSKVNTDKALYYSGNYPGVGKGKSVETHKEANLNSEEVVCALNGGKWIVENETETCSGNTSNVWSEGQSSISMNGSDGYKVSFNANGGSFASGAKTFKIVANGATITADEITAPTRTDMDPNTNMTKSKKFAGWATTTDAIEPTELGVADANKTLYAVWYDFYTVTFEINSVTHETRTISVPKHGHVSAEGFTLPASYSIPNPDDAENPIKYFFTGWAYATKWLAVNTDPTPTDTLHLADIDVVADVPLYPVWTRAETFSVAFDATLHGKTHVRFVKKVNDGDKVAKPGENDVVADPGYKIIGWCTNANCTEGSVYNFDAQLKSNLTLYAEWDTVEYKISYEMNGGTNNVSNPTFYTVESDPITFAEPTYPGYKFIGWFYDAGFTSPATGIAKNSTTGEKTLYAKWEQIFYTVEYLSGNELSATIVADKKPWGESVTLKGDEVAFQREGYIHDGWSLTPGGTIAYNFGATYDKYKDLVLFPHWVEGAPDVVHNGAVTIYTYSETHKVAEINGDYKGLDAFSIDEDIPVTSVVLNRSLTPYVPVTMTLPFDIAVDNVENAKFYAFGGISIDGNGKKAVEANRVKTGTLEANTPYIVIPLAQSITFSGAVVLRETAEPVVELGNWEFVGTYAYKTVAQENVGSIYGISGSAEGNISQGKFVKFAEGCNFVPMRAYLLNKEISNRRLAKSLYSRPASTEIAEFGINWNEDDEVEPEEQTTVVRKIMKTPSILRMDRVFDLKGRLVNEKSKPRGVYFNK
ncbi:Listeria/Bacterioides repeat-containing protein [Fibrobacter sp. UWR3]|uniref:InlB B-repeat-containing protein n=1 Tax=Fibrobacter sp. UWR3 TaxID=1896217 RepID=UPI0009241BCC|nr:InlB B-repeat-containing protein [Fibrobacter sp. UWR3]SHM95768.1 Listeria/Bacterioides repeat-containing protein [Fibrobacter sp. UWR3]